MVYLSLNLFKYILSFKDPRYERVRNGDPFGATPTRVWYTYKECNKAENPYKNVHMPDLPFEYHWGSPCIRRYGPEKQKRLEWVHGVEITILGKYFLAYGEHTEKVVFGGISLFLTQMFQTQMTKSTMISSNAAKKWPKCLYNVRHVART